MTEQPRFPRPEQVPMSKESIDFIGKLLTKDPAARLGSTNGGEEVLQHPWFHGVDTDAIYEKTAKAPFVPELSDDVLNVEHMPDAYA